MFIQNLNSYSTKPGTDNTLPVLHDILEGPSSDGLVKAVRLTYQEVTTKLERNLVMPYICYL
jgi:hypothetical protein